jgi:DNA polymerase-3 subunit beta
MKFIISAKALRNNLQAVLGIMNSSNTMPILDDFLFELQGENLTIKGSDLETTMSIVVPVDRAEGEGVVAVPARLLVETLKTFTDIPVTFDIDTDSFSVELITQDGKYKFIGHDPLDFPTIPEKNDLSSININSDHLRNGFVKTIFASSNDDMRPIMTGVLMEIYQDNIDFVATDAHKLVRYTRKDVSAENEAAVVLPKKPINHLKNILPVDTNVKIEFNTKNVFFSYDNVFISSRLISGKYPEYRAVVPTENPNVLEVDRISFMLAIKRSALYANQSTNQIVIDVKSTNVVISSEDLDFSNASKETLPCNYSGEEMLIGFNAKFFYEMLGYIDSERVKLEMSTPNRAVLLVPEEVDENEDILMMIMPIMTR